MAEIEMALGWCVLLNVAVFAAAYRFAKRRVGGDWVQVILDALLLFYAVQYVAVGIPGVLGVMRPGVIAGVAILISVGLWWGAGREKKLGEAGRWTGSQIVVLAAGAFAVCFLLAYARFTGLLPVMSNDALTYHFPAAAQWLQHGRIDLFPVWFFNPANTYSPLGGSTFIVWLMGPFGNDVAARFVEVPALIFVGVGIFQIGRQLGADDATAALVAAGAVTRPFLKAAMMGKDDLFVVAFFLCALIGLIGKRAQGKFGPLRVGVALGLMLATKYTAALSLPILLLAVDGTWKAGKGGWRWKQWLGVAGIVGAIAGPWYLRNFWLTGNPIFPLDISVGSVHLFRGLFTTAVSDRLRTVGAWGVLTGDFAIPMRLMVLMTVGWVALAVGRWRLFRSEPMVRVCLLGPVVGLMLFVWRSPFAEVRFVFPVVAILFGVVAGAIALLRPVWLRWVVAAAWIPAVGFTAFFADLETFANEFLVGAMVATAAVVFFVWLMQRWPRRARLALQMILALVVVGYSYVFWAAYLMQYQEGLFLGGAAWDNVYPRERPLWEFVNQQIPADATVAYTNLYLIYPLQGFSLQRRVVYAPTRAGMRTLADLPWLGDHLSGEELVPAADRATVAEADENVWLKNLRQSGAGYLVVGKGGVLGLPPEAGFAGGDIKHFRRLFEGAAGTVYAINW